MCCCWCVCFCLFCPPLPPHVCVCVVDVSGVGVVGFVVADGGGRVGWNGVGGVVGGITVDDDTCGVGVADVVVGCRCCCWCCCW